MSKMAILSAYRKKKFSSVPNFSNEARTVYLLPDAETKRIINRLESDEAKVGYLVRRAYFRAKGSFFPITMAELKDIRTAKRLLGINAKLDWDKYTSKMASYHRQLILEQCEWAPYSSDSNRNELEAHASLFVDKIPEREDILFALLDYCWRRRIEIPSYTELATIVSNSFSVFNDRLKATLSTHITQGVEETLHDLVLNPESIVKLKQLKSINQSTVTSHLNTAACELRFFKDLYFDVKTLAEKMNFTVEARQHFSKIVKDMTVTGLRKLKDKNDLSLKLLGFVEDQYIRRNDASILAFLKLMREWNNKAKKHDSTIKERESKALESATESVVNTAKSANAILNEIKRIMADIKMSDGERLTKIKDLLAAYEEATNPNINNYIEAVLTGVEHSKNNTRKMHFLYRNSIGIQRAVSPLLKLLLIDKENSDHKVTEAFEYFIESDGNVKEADAPVAFITTTDKVVMDTDKTTSYREKYKVMLFLALEKAIRAKKVNFLFSHSFQPAHKLQISDTLWKEKCEEFLKAAELLRFKDGEQVLTDVGEMTSNIIIQANKNLESGVNRYVSVRNGKWKLAEYEADFDTSQYIPGLLKGSKKVLLYKALAELDEELHFSDEFMIPNQIGALTKPDKKYIYGVLISLGTNMGHHELARASDLNEKALRDMDATRFTKKKLENVIKIIVKRIQNIDLAAIYEEEKDEIHSSSDGKKIVVAVDSLLANYSYKYYGKQQGISANSFVDNKQSFFHVNVLSSSEREAAYMIDGLVRARENIYEESEKDLFVRDLDDETFNKKTHRHSTDEFGYTDAAFTGLFFLNVSYAPRFKEIEERTLHSYTHSLTRSKSTLPVVPNSAINKKLILENWDDILRLMTTIKLGYASASTLFRMLSSKGDSALYKAMKEFGKLLKTQFIYSYMDDNDLRRRIQKQLNRAELGQKFKAAIFHGRGGKLKVGDLENIDKAMLSCVVLQNIIVLWNYLFLKKHLKEISSKEERESEIELISKGSVIAWAHFNMAGTLDFEHLDFDSFGIPLSRLFRIKSF